MVTCSPVPPLLPFLLSLSPSPWPHLCFLRLLPVLVLCLGESTCQCRRCKRCKFNFWVRKIPWSRKCNPLQYSCLGNSKDTGTCWATVHGVPKSRTQLSDFPLTFHFPSIRVFSNESVLCIRCPKYWSFSFSISASNKCSGLISFRINWLNLLAVQGTLKILLQHHSSKASILQCLAFFIVQLSHPYLTTGKTIALTGWTFVGKVMFLLFNMLSSLIIAFLPRSTRLLI